MIAIISSCIYPEENSNLKKSHFTNDERLAQTLHTIKELKSHPFSTIILVDNSATNKLDLIKSAFEDVITVHIKQYQFNNKGINEFLMLLAILKIMPDNEPIFKISGRYLPNEKFDMFFDEAYDFKVKAYEVGTKRFSISTRGYFVKNKEIYEDFLLKTLNETFVYPQRVVGFRSLINFSKQLFNPNFDTTHTSSVEFAGARVLKYSNYKIQYADEIGINGVIAGFENKSTIRE